jgi:hypothetical protein
VPGPRIPSPAPRAAHGSWGAGVGWHGQVAAWKHGLDRSPKLPTHGFHYWEEPAGGYLELAVDEPGGRFPLVQFIGCRAFEDGPFNAVEALNDKGMAVTIPCAHCWQFNWVRP